MAPVVIPDVVWAALAEHAARALGVLNDRGVLCWVAPTTPDVLGRDAAGLVSHLLADFVHEGDRAAYAAFLAGSERSEGVRDTVLAVRLVRPDGQDVAVELVADERLAGVVVRAVGAGRELGGGRGRLASVLGSGGSHAVTVVVLSELGAVEDRFGSEVAAGVVAAVVAALGSLESVQAVVRLSHATFAVLVGPGGDRDGLVGAVSALVARLDEPVDVGGVALNPLPVAGVALAPLHGEDADTLLARARRAARVASSTRTRVQVWEPSMDIAGHERLALLSAFGQALERGEVFLEYQAKVDLASGASVGAEALVRWRHPGRGVLRPSAFLPSVEAAPLLRPFTLHVVSAALREWYAAVGREDRRRVSVNLPTPLLGDPTLADAVADAVVAAGVPATRLELELTERGVLPTTATARRNLARLRDLGVRISLDDFGSGNASWGHIKKLSVDEIKVDRAFVHRCERDAGNRAVVEACVHVARGLGILVLAEGVETAGELAAVREVGFDRAQGFFLGRPGSVAAAAQARWDLTAGGTRPGAA